MWTALSFWLVRRVLRLVEESFAARRLFVRPVSVPRFRPADRRARRWLGAEFVLLVVMGVGFTVYAPYSGESTITALKLTCVFFSAGAALLYFVNRLNEAERLARAAKRMTLRAKG